MFRYVDVYTVVKVISLILTCMFCVCTYLFACACVIMLWLDYMYSALLKLNCCSWACSFLEMRNI